jgi:hypothetical protein
MLRRGRFKRLNIPSPNRYLRDGRDKALEECGGRVQALTQQVREKDAEKKSLEEKKGALTKELANAKVGAG